MNEQVPISQGFAAACFQPPLVALLPLSTCCTLFMTPRHLSLIIQCHDGHLGNDVKLFTPTTYGEIWMRNLACFFPGSERKQGEL